MPSSRNLETKNIFHRDLIFYALVAIAIVLIMYYVPDYFFLERAAADHTAFLLNVIGIKATSTTVGNRAFVNEIQIVKDCTGIQVLAVFLGLLVPLPNASPKKKVLTLSIVSAILYSANVLRIALEFWLVHFHILPWTLAHYPLSLLLGILGVFVLVLVTDRFLPEFGRFIFRVTQKASK